MTIFENIINFLFFNRSRIKLIVNEFKLDKRNYYVWGMKSTGENIRNKKKRRSNLKIIYLGNGFIDSFGGGKSKIPLSICNDNNGIYYNYKSSSDLFDFLKVKISNEEILRSRKIISLWKQYSISKYNYTNFLKPPKKPFVLLIDQFYDDLSISHGGANISTFQRMYEFAIKKWPDLMIVIKLQPEVISKWYKGCLDENLYYNKNVQVISEQGQLNNLLESCTALCVVTSQVGFEGLIYNKEVHVFGSPFYSGLGLTIDHAICNGRQNKAACTLEQLVFSALVKYQTYLDPRNKKICEIEKIMDYIHKKREINNFFPNNLYCLNLTPWKVRQIYRFTKEIEGIKLAPLIKYSPIMKNVLVWGKSIKFDKIPKSKNNTFITAEDGFIRSVGLGGDLFSPFSLLFDKKGIHYDPNKPSDLEDLLQNRFLNDEELQRSKKLIRQIKIKKISKYNLKSDIKFLYKKKFHEQKVILVLGQVETDNSILYGVPDNTIKKSNYSLVCKVRKDFPNDYIIYKPHPDIEKGLRSKGVEEKFIKNIADSIANKIAIEELFKISDRVVVFTSLGGFEALIRGLPVTCYGLPFYSGWGLTEDKFLNDLIKKRRTRRLTLEELVFIALVKYPCYFSLKFNCHTEIEDIIEEMDVYGKNKKNIEQIIFRYWGVFKDFIKQRKFFR